MTPKIELLNIDCMEYMATLPDKSIDMILCDLPYGTTDCKWDIVIPFDKLWANYKRIIKQNGTIVLTGSQPFTSALIMSNVTNFKHELIWDKMGTGNPLNAKKHPLNIHENILVFCYGTLKYNPIMRLGTPYKKNRSKIIETVGKVRNNTNNYTGLYYPTSLLTFPKHSMIGSNEERCKTSIHPTQKPVPLFEYLIATYSDKGDMVLDNCMGSGTTAIACYNTGRNFVGCELDKDYYDAACKRLKEQTMQQSLFL